MSRKGDRHTRAWRTWRGMISRCENERDRSYPSYGGRGITVCERWKDLANFKADMGEPPAGKTLDRIDNDMGYEPANCRWATPIEQSRNRRCVRKVNLGGQVISLPELADRAGMSVRTLRQRLDAGWTPERAISVPLGSGNFRFTVAEEREIARRVRAGRHGIIRQLTAEYGVTRNTIWHIMRRQVEHFDDDQGRGGGNTAPLAA